MTVENLNSKKVKVIGIGGAGMNTINNLIDLNLEGVTFVSINTDISSFKKSKAEINLFIGEKITNGKGTNGNPLIGRGAVFQRARDLKQILTDSRLVFIITGLGGVTGTGAAPFIAKLGKDIGAKVIAIVSTPFSFEGKQREIKAHNGILALNKIVDTIIVRPNDRIRDGVAKDDTISAMYKKADEKIYHLIKGLLKNPT